MKAMDDARKYRNQHVAEHEDKNESDHQHESENQYLRVGKMAVNPVADHCKHAHVGRNSIVSLRQLPESLSQMANITGSLPYFRPQKK
jgi:hypothetical protein